MTTDIVKAESANTPQRWTPDDLKLIRDTVAKGADDSEFKLFLYTANRYGLDPLVKQIWCIKYGGQPAAIFTSRDGFLAIAHRSGQFDGIETKAVRNDKGQLVAAICRVWRKDMQHPFEVEVPRNEYDTGKGNWLKMPETMLKKVAESQALRKAFEISGLYDPSEYDPAEQAGATRAETVNTVTGEIVSATSEHGNCPNCNSPLQHKSGIKEGRKWAGLFCPDRECGYKEWLHLKKQEPEQTDPIDEPF